MNTKKIKVTQAEGLYFALLMVLVANYVSIKIWHYPFLYCWTGSTVHLLYDSAFTFLQIIIAAWVVWKVLTLRVAGAILGILVYGFLLKAPEFASIIFAVGSSCG